MDVQNPAAEAVRRFPGPPQIDPPTSPPHKGTGVVGGARWDDWRTGGHLPTAAQRRSRCDSSPGAAVAAKTPHRPEQRRLCGRRATKEAQRTTGAAVEPLIAGFPEFSGPASGVAGDRGGDLAGSARSAVDQNRPVRQAGRSRAA